MGNWVCLINGIVRRKRCVSLCSGSVNRVLGMFM